MGGTSTLSRKTNRTLQAGIQHHTAGRLAEAEECYYQVLEVEPRCSDALHLLGVVAQQKGNYHESVRLIKTAIHQNARVATYHGNLGNTFQLQGALEDAIRYYQNALSLEPANHGFRHSLACTLFRHGDFAYAEDAFRCVLEAQPNFADAHYNLGNLRYRIGKMQDAAASYRQAAALRPDCFDFHVSLGDSLYATGDYFGAAQAYQQALEIKPKNGELLRKLGAALKQSGNLEATADVYRQALEQNSNDAVALSMLGVVLTDTGDLRGAAQMIKRSLEIEPNSPDALCNLSKLYVALGDLQSAMQCTKRALEIDQSHPFSLCDLGFHLELLGDLPASMQCHELALKSNPDFAWARFQLGVVQLASGNFAEGWQNYESRWRTPDFRRQARPTVRPQWKGQDLRGARIFVYAEQGLGDTLQFARYIPMLKSLGAEVCFEVQPGLHRLLHALDGADRVIARGDAIPDHDFQCPLMSLPMGFRTDMNSIPARVPYLTAPEETSCAWAERLDSSRFRVGIVWSGNPKHTRERYRAIPLRVLAELSTIQGTAFYSLQKGPKASEIGELDAGSNIIDLDSQQADFADTAAIVANLDLVITIDTSVAHLAGGMGKPVWILLHHAPDWRWLRERDNSPWYPTAQLFRQSHAGNWNDVMNRVAQQLRVLTGANESMNVPSIANERAPEIQRTSLANIVELLTNTSTGDTSNAVHTHQPR